MRPTAARNRLFSRAALLVALSIALGLALAGVLFRDRLVTLSDRLSGYSYPGSVLVPTERGIERFDFAQRRLEPLYVASAGNLVSGVSLSPDRRLVAFALFHRRPEDPASVSEIFLVDSSGANSRRVAERDRPGDVLEAPVFAPDGQSLYFAVSGQSGGRVFQRIERVATQGGPKQVVVEEGHSPAVTADGQALLYLKEERNGTGLWLRALVAGSEAKLVIRPDQYPGLAVPRGSPDGRRFSVSVMNSLNAGRDTNALVDWLLPPAAFAHGLPWDIWTFELDGQNPRRLTQISADDPSADWSPDGAHLAFWAANGLFVVAADGSGLRQITERGGYGPIAWGP